MNGIIVAACAVGVALVIAFVVLKQFFDNEEADAKMAEAGRVAAENESDLRFQIARLEKRESSLEARVSILEASTISMLERESRKQKTETETETNYDN